jgi:predicted TIM-barrel fold metal-dependent hydrolase
MMIDRKFLKIPLEPIGDEEGAYVPEHAPPIIDAHVHLFPHPIFKAVWEWFGQYGWPIRYQMKSRDILKFLFSRGIRHAVALQYAHKPGMARELNQYMARQCQAFPEKVTGFATVFPGEEGAEDIIREGFSLGLRGVKLHAHVQCFDMSAGDMDVIYETCSSEKMPLVMHVGREPKSPAYVCDPYELCHADKLEPILRDFPELKICVPHLGMDEFLAYQGLLEKYDNLWLDTAMALTDFFPGKPEVNLKGMRGDRIMFGTDFPNLPFAWDREIKWLLEADLSDEALERIFAKNAMDFFNIELVGVTKK